MWRWMHRSPEVDPAFFSSASELLQSTSRQIILTTGLVYAAWHFIATLTWPHTVGSHVWLITPLVVVAVRLLIGSLPKTFWQARNLAIRPGRGDHDGDLSFSTPGVVLLFRAFTADGSPHGWLACRHGGGAFACSIDGMDLPQSFHAADSAKPWPGRDCQ